MNIRRQPNLKQIFCFGLIFTCLAGLIGYFNFADSFKNSELKKADSVINLQQKAQIEKAHGKLPLSFEANQGQTDSKVKYLARGSGYSLFLTPTEAVLSLRDANKPAEVSEEISSQPRKNKTENRAAETSVVRMKLLGANAKPEIAGEGELSGKSNYFIGKDKSKWQTNVSSFKSVKYKEVYEGIDLVYYGNQRELEYDFLVAPGVDPQKIAFEFEGADKVFIDEEGNLVLNVGGREIRQKKPYTYQVINGKCQEIASNYVLKEGKIKFELAEYDKAKELVIDPILAYATYFGGSGNDSGNSIKVDADGNAYITGSTASIDFPGTANDTAQGSDGDVFVTKLNADGTSVIYSTYFGGTGADSGAGIALDSNGNVFITGTTNSSNFPTSANAFQTNNAGGVAPFYITENNGQTWIPSASGIPTSNVSVIRLHPINPSIIFAGTFGNSGVYKSVDGGNSWSATNTGLSILHINDISIDSNNPDKILVSGGGGVAWTNDGGGSWTTATGLPLSPATTTENLLIDPNNSNIVYVSYGFASGLYKSENGGQTFTFSGSGLPNSNGSYSGIYGLAIDSQSLTIYAATELGVYRSTDGGNSWSGSAQPAGVPGDGESLVIDGSTNPSTLYLGTTNGVYQSTDGLNWTAINSGLPQNPGVTTLALDKSTTPATLFAGTPGSGVLKFNEQTQTWSSTGLSNSSVYSVAVETRTQPNRIYIGTYNGSDAFVTKLDSTGSAIVYSTYLGGGGGQIAGTIPDDLGNAIAVDANGNAYITGYTRTDSFPTVNAAQETFKGFIDVFVTKINSSGTGLVYSTFLSGNGNNQGRGIAVDAFGNAYVTGVTTGNNFPTVNALQNFSGGAEVFVTKYTSNGSYAFSTYLGGSGSDQGWGITLDSANNIYVTGQTGSANFPLTNPIQSVKDAGNDAFITKLNSDGSSRLYSTYLGGNGNDVSRGIAVDQIGNMYVVGQTASTNFPVSNDAVQTSNGGGNDAFVTKISADGTSRIYSSYFGGNGSDQGFGIAVNGTSNFYITGVTASNNLFTSGGMQAVNAGGNDAFVAKFGAATGPDATDLKVTITDSPDPASLNNNDNITYTINVSNIGEADVTGVTLTNTIPANTTFVSATPNCSGTTTISCNVGNLTAGQSKTVIIVIKPTQGGSVSNTVSVAGNEAETNTANNSATANTMVVEGNLFTVNSDDGGFDGVCDSANCTIRDAVAAANNNGAGKDTIIFDIPGGGAKTINLQGSINGVDTPMIFDATTQPGYAGKPIIELSGASAGDSSGFVLNANGSTIRGFVINRFNNGHGISVNSNNHIIEGNYIGTSLNGDVKLPVSYSGIWLAGSNNQIGGTTPDKRNVISGYGHQALAITGSNNKIEGNFIGTNASGTASLGGEGGIIIWRGASDNKLGGAGWTTGGSCVGACNLISGNNESIWINNWQSTGATRNVIEGNFIGVNVDGTAAIPNNSNGITFDGTNGNIARHNLVSGNNASGIVAHAGASNSLIENNFIGTNSAGTAAIPNTYQGIAINRGHNTTVTGNLVSGNNGGGIYLNTDGNGGSTNNYVKSNYIGTDVTGMNALGNKNTGIAILGGANNNQIGGVNTGEGNVSSANQYAGLSISDGSANNTVQGNFLGTNKNGDAAIPNNSGIDINGNGTINNVIGGTVPGARNVISGNNGNGIGVGAGATGTVIQGNYIGLNAAGTAALTQSNWSPGIGLYSATGVTVGGYSPEARNVISGNQGPGIFITNTYPGGTPGSSNNKVIGNYIGTSPDGLSLIKNNGGVSITEASSNNLIGGDDDDDGALDGNVKARNVIAGGGVNISWGTNGVSSFNTVQGNYIGIKADGSAPLNNYDWIPGVALNGATDNLIGGETPGAGNVISGSNGPGIWMAMPCINCNPAQPAIPSSNNRVYGNIIGLNPTQTAKLGNGNGIEITAGGFGNIIGGLGQKANVIAGNNSDGIVISDNFEPSHDNVIQGNYVGINRNGVAFGNTYAGIGIYGGINNTIGGATRAEGNIIGSNGGTGINMWLGNNQAGVYSTSNGNTIRNNFIGTDSSGNTARPNNAGINLNGASNSVVTDNIISGNTGNGINISYVKYTDGNSITTAADAKGNQIQRNLVGVKADGISALANTGSGIALFGSSENIIGGDGNGNTIAFNNLAGINASCSNLSGTIICSTKNQFVSNSIYSNLNVGIFLGSNGANFANGNIAAPSVSFAVQSGSNTRAVGTINTTANTSATIEFFANDVCDASGAGEGQTFIGSTQITTDGSGAGNFNVSTLAGVAAGKIITATTTTAVNGTSRFSTCIAVANPTASISGRVSDEGNPIVGATINLSGSQTATATSDTNGNYIFANLSSEGNYTLSVTNGSDSFHPATVNFSNLTGNQVANFIKRRIQYSITDLGTLGGTSSFGLAINESGHIVGQATTANNAATRGFFYNGTMIDMGTLGGTSSYAWGINDAGKAVGYSQITGSSATRSMTYQNGILTDIGTLGGMISMGRSINNSGQVVGISTNASNQQRAYRTAPNAAINPATDNLGTLPGGTFSQATAINESGQVVGISGSSNGNRAFMYDGNVMLDLGTLGGTGSSASDINDAGVVVGQAEYQTGNIIARAFRYSGGTMSDLGTLGGLRSTARGINNAGVIVGASETNPAAPANTYNAFIYKDGVMVDLNSRIPANTGWTNLFYAYDINEAGQIAGYGIINGESHAFLLTPVTTTNKTDQTITFGSLANKTFGDVPFMVNASASSGLPVSFSVSGPVTINGNTITITGAGVVTVTASQPGNETYNAATPVSQSFNVAKANQTISFGTLPARVFGEAPFNLGANSSSGLPVTFQVVSGPAVVNGNTVTITGAGDVTVRASQSGDNNYNAASDVDRVFRVEKANTTTAVSDVTVTSAPATINLQAQVAANAPSTAAVNQGNITFTITQGNPATVVGSPITVPVAGGSTNASVNLPAGAYKVYASYSSPSGNFNGSNALGSITVGTVNPVPVITVVNPASIQSGGSGFTLTVNGSNFKNGVSTVRWNGANRPTTFVSSTKLEAAITAADILAESTASITVFNSGLGGGLSNPQTFFVTNTTATVTSSSSATSDPTTGTATASTATASGGIITAQAASDPSGGTVPSGTLTVAQYSSDPVGGGSAGASFSGTGGFLDLHVSPDSTFQTLTLDYCNSGGTTLYWWNENAWTPVSNQIYNPVTGCVTVVFDETTNPAISDLTGTVLAVGSGPVIGEISVEPSTPISKGEAVTLNTSFTDPDGQGPYTAEIFWGDSASPQTVEYQNPGTITASHNYIAEGVYTVKVKVTRADGLFGSSTYSQYVVVNDPSGADSVFGAGWIKSPAGSFASNPKLKAKVKFGFYVKKVGNKITGVTLLRTGNIIFYSTKYDSLTVSDNKAQFKGSGKINGRDNYGILVTAIDGKAKENKKEKDKEKSKDDKLRIKIWDKVTGQVIYDSQFGAPDSADPVTGIKGGKIIIK